MLLIELEKKTRDAFKTCLKALSSVLMWILAWNKEEKTATILTKTVFSITTWPFVEVKNDLILEDQVHPEQFYLSNLTVRQQALDLFLWTFFLMHCSSSESKSSEAVFSLVEELTKQIKMFSFFSRNSSSIITGSTITAFYHLSCFTDFCPIQLLKTLTIPRTCIRSIFPTEWMWDVSPCHSKPLWLHSLLDCPASLLPCWFTVPVAAELS